VPKAFEFAESFSKPASLPLASFQKWWALSCPLYKRELFIGNLFRIKKLARLSLAMVFKSSRCNSDKYVIL
jgi:hypothetical protein